MKERAKEHVSVNGYGQRVRWEGVGRKISFGILLTKGSKVFFFFLIFIYLFIYLFIFGSVGSSFLCEGFL